MTFKKENKYRYEQGDRPKDEKPLTIRLYKGDLVKLKNLDGWQDRVRDIVEELLKHSNLHQ
jgi:AAA+ ATPase superfamily predicted ATPase